MADMQRAVALRLVAILAVCGLSHAELNASTAELLWAPCDARVGQQPVEYVKHNVA